MKPIGALASLFLLGGCSSSEEKALAACSNWIRGGLVAPATFNVASSAASVAGDEYRLTVQYDASNRMGVPLRAAASCSFDHSGGKPIVDTPWSDPSHVAPASEALLTSRPPCCSPRARNQALSDELNAAAAERNFAGQAR